MCLFFVLNFNFVLFSGYYIWYIVWLEKANKFRLKYPNNDLNKNLLLLDLNLVGTKYLVLNLVHVLQL